MPADYSGQKHGPATLDESEVALRTAARAFHDPGAEQLVEYAIARQEGLLAHNGALVVRTGQFTGRSPKDKFIVRDELTESEVDWGAVNQPISPRHFDALYARALAFITGRDMFVENCLAGADPEYSLSVRVITELA